MIKIPYSFGILSVCVAFMLTTNAYAIEYSVVSDINAGAVYNDNIFLTSQPHETVTGLIITPTLGGVIKGENWNTVLDARIVSNNYSDPNLDSTDQFFGLSGSYLAERNIFALTVDYDLDSNLSSTSSDFGLTGKRVNREIQRITPRYTRLLSERANLTLSYAYADVDYLEAENTGYTPYITETGTASLIYDLTEKDVFSIRLSGVDYTSKNNLVTYQMFTSGMGLNHEFSETLRTDFLIGISRQNSTNLSTETFDFFGNVIAQTQEIDVKNRNLVLDAGVVKQLETGAIAGRVSRSNTTNSFGGINRIHSFKINFNDAISSLWRYVIKANVEDITAVSSSPGSADRDVFSFEASTSYSISRSWSATASYIYTIRRYKSDTSDNKAPYSNRLYVGLSYNIPSLSTF